MKTRGWIAVFASAFMIVVVTCIGIFLAKAIAEHRLTTYDSDTAEMFGRVFTALALIVLSGLLGIASGIGQIRTGRRSRALTIAVVVSFIAAFGVVALSVSGRH